MNSSARHCECRLWAMSGKLAPCGHNLNCPERLDSERGWEDLVGGLITGMICWGADEDGIHPEAWEAYCRARMALGMSVPPEGRDDE